VLVLSALLHSSCRKEEQSPAPEPPPREIRTLPPREAQELTPLARCERNLRALGLAARVHAEQTDTPLDPDDWAEELLPYLRGLGHDASVLTCPMDEADADISYAINDRALEADHPADGTVLFFESDGRSSGAREDMVRRHDGSALLSTTDGAVVWVEESSYFQIDDGEVLDEAVAVVW
jgi:hypothetical protein